MNKNQPTTKRFIRQRIALEMYKPNLRNPTKWMGESAKKEFDKAMKRQWKKYKKDNYG